MRIKQHREPNGLVFVLPALILYTFVVGLPPVMTILYAFTDWRVGAAPEFIGLENFRRMFTPAEWVVSLAVKNNLIWMALMLLMNTSLAILASGLLTNISARARQVLRVVFFMPVILPRTVVCRIWMWLFNPFVGLRSVLEQFGFGFPGLGDPSTVLYSISLVGVWCWWGFPLVIFLSSLQQIEPTYYEAASLEGANRIQLYTRITIPMLKPTLIFVAVLTIITSFQIFDLIYIMTWGGPGKSSEVLATLIYKHGILQFESGYGSALATLQILISSIGIAGYIYTQKKEWETS